MYKSIFKIQTEYFDISSQEIFTPFVECYYLQSVILSVNGVGYEQGVDFIFLGNKTKWKGEFLLEDTDSLIFDINYFYIRPDHIDVLGFLVNSTYRDPVKSKEIISKHYIEGQFSLDNGLYKNAVLNFGTALDGMLNKQLVHADLNDLIKSYAGTANKDDMHFIRKLRNKVHPNQISANPDVSREEAVQARNKLEVTIKHI